MTGLIIVTALALLVGIALTAANRYLVPNQETLSEKINQLLPQTQCGQCGYPGCRPYAQAIATQQAPINQCPPGGDALIRALSDMLNRPAEPLNPQYGQHKPAAIAVIDEAQCIGCALCLPACPVDAIVGAPKYLHRVIAQQCTGCELCIAPCPVNCIQMDTVPEPVPLPPPDKAANPCIRCDQCGQICPVHLDAQTLYHQIRLTDYAAAMDITRCIECGYCDDVCPSHIPLLHFYRFGKQEIHRLNQAQQQAAQAQKNHSAKNHRLTQMKVHQEQIFADHHAALKMQIRENTQTKKTPIVSDAQ